MHFSPRLLSMVAAAALLASGIRAAETPAAGSIDWEKARALHQKSVAGEALTPEDQAYLDRAIAARQAQSPLAAVLARLSPEEQQQARILIQKRQSGEPLTDAERALRDKIQGLLATQRRAPGAPAGAGAPPHPPRDHTGLVPLDQMTGGQTYQGREGGLYGEGRNEPPAGHLNAALAAAARVVPRDRSGQPANDGRIVLLSVGMSNTTQEFSRFKEMADGDPSKSPSVVLVDGAQGGQAAAQWAASPENEVWRTVGTRLANAGVTTEQVQVVWLKQAEIRPTEPFPRDAEKLTKDEGTIVRMLKTRFPNLQLIYLSSRIYGGYATTALNPEPYAYESAYAVRDLIRRQIAGEAELNFDSSRGAAVAPVLLWGPYLWADGVVPRKSDGLIWRREDLREDGTHPSVTSGRDKVANLLLAFFRTDPTAKGWFVRK